MMQYLYLMMTSWAIVCEVWYLPPMYQDEDESAIDFANRVKRVISRQGGLVDLMWLVSVNCSHFFLPFCSFCLSLTNSLRLCIFKIVLIMCHKLPGFVRNSLQLRHKTLATRSTYNLCNVIKRKQKQVEHSRFHSQKAEFFMPKSCQDVKKCQKL